MKTAMTGIYVMLLKEFQCFIVNKETASVCVCK